MNLKVKNVDGEIYLDRISKVFFKDDIIPEQYKDATKYDVFVLDSNRPNKEVNNE